MIVDTKMVAEVRKREYDALLDEVVQLRKHIENKTMDDMETIPFKNCDVRKLAQTINTKLSDVMDVATRKIPLPQEKPHEVESSIDQDESVEAKEATVDEECIKDPEEEANIESYSFTALLKLFQQSDQKRKEREKTDKPVPRQRTTAFRDRDNVDIPKKNDSTNLIEPINSAFDYPGDCAAVRRNEECSAPDSTQPNSDREHDLSNCCKSNCSSVSGWQEPVETETLTEINCENTFIEPSVQADVVELPGDFRQKSDSIDAPKIRSSSLVTEDTTRRERCRNGCQRPM